MQVSVIVTVFNERTSIARLLDSLAAQTRRPDEVVICDGGSSDGTDAFIADYARRHPARLPGLRVIVAPGANISRGRNVAIAAARGPLIAATDAGVRLSDTWLERLVEPWTRPGPPPLAVAGMFAADAQGVGPDLRRLAPLHQRAARQERGRAGERCRHARRHPPSARIFQHALIRQFILDIYGRIDGNAVPRMNARAFNMLHNAGHENIFAVANSIDLKLAAHDIFINKNGLIRIYFNRSL